jgi:hypothetical protein
MLNFKVIEDYTYVELLHSHLRTRSIHLVALPPDDNSIDHAYRGKAHSPEREYDDESRVPYETSFNGTSTASTLSPSR